MTTEKAKEILNNKDLNGLLEKVDKLPTDAQSRVATAIQGFLIASDYYTNKASA